MINSARFKTSEEEDLTSGSGTRLDHSRALAQQSFIKVRKGTENASDIDIRKGTESAPPSYSKQGSYILF